MKYILILGDGMADYPISQLNNKTPLQYAKNPILIFLPKCRGGYGKNHPGRIPPEVMLQTFL